VKDDLIDLLSLPCPSVSFGARLIHIFYLDLYRTADGIGLGENGPDLGRWVAIYGPSLWRSRSAHFSRVKGFSFCLCGYGVFGLSLASVGRWGNFVNISLGDPTDLPAYGDYEWWGSYQYVEVHPTFCMSYLESSGTLSAYFLSQKG
jgi:hypothetical protein